jgi:single-strand DNA-binding protein
MNSVTLVGRIVREFSAEYTRGGDAMCTFTIAVDRVSKTKVTDFIKIKVFGKQAENAAKYLGKGSKCAVQGALQADTYEKRDGSKGQDTYVLAQRVEYLDSKKTEGGSTQLASMDISADFTEVDEAIPF